MSVDRRRKRRVMMSSSPSTSTKTMVAMTKDQRVEAGGLLPLRGGDRARQEPGRIEVAR